jgi:hypothetical protein
MAALLCAMALARGAEVQGQEACRQGVLALMLMIDAEEQDRSHYRSTAASVVRSCGPPPAAKASSAQVPFDKAACGRLASAMLEAVEAAKMGSAEFVAARDGFAAQCRGG